MRKDTACGRFFVPMRGSATGLLRFKGQLTMKTVSLILTMTCHANKRSGRYNAVGETWLRTWGHLVDHKYVLGIGLEPEGPDDLMFDVPDDYWHMAWKMAKAVAWAVDQRYKHIFVSYDDTYVNVPHLLQSGYERWDYTGKPCENDPNLSGGAGFWLSREAAEVIAHAPPRAGYDDAWAGVWLARAGIKPIWDWRYGVPYLHPQAITSHMSRGTGNFDPSLMASHHRATREMMSLPVYHILREELP